MRCPNFCEPWIAFSLSRGRFSNSMSNDHSKGDSNRTPVCFRSQAALLLVESGLLNSLWSILIVDVGNQVKSTLTQSYQ
jgi:hypothetical protein